MTTRRLQAPAPPAGRTLGPTPTPALAASRSPAVHDVLRDAGRPLAEPVRQEMESRLGADFSSVRVHTDAAAQRSAADLGARAYTSGEHIVMGLGTANRLVLAHELTHVLQQRTGPVAGTDHGEGLRVSDPSDRFEREAETGARSAMAGQAAVRHRPQVAYSGHAPGRTAVRTAGSAIQRLVSVDWDDLGGGAYGAKSVQIVRDASSTGGAHSTANVVFEQQIREAIEAQTFGNAFKKLIDLVTGVLGYDELYTKKSTANHKRAIAILIEIRDTDPATIVPLRQQSVLQKSAQDYITARNLMDDAIITGVTGTKAIGEESEKTHKTIIKNAKDTINNSGGTSGVLPYAKSLVALFDYQSVVAAYPKMKDIAPLFARHVKDIFRAFPLGDPKYEAKVVEAMPTQGTQIEKSLVKKFL